jgi:hypothetical protein
VERTSRGFSQASPRRGRFQGAPGEDCTQEKGRAEGQVAELAEIPKGWRQAQSEETLTSKLVKPFPCWRCNAGSRIASAHR